jgi:phage-related protein
MPRLVDGEHQLFHYFKRQAGLFFLITGLLLIFSAPSFAGPNSHKSKRKNYKFKQEQKSNFRIAGNSQSQRNSNRRKYSTGNKKQLKSRAEKFRSMSPSKQKELREKMNRFEKLSPREQNTYKKRYRQMQELPPAERKNIRKKLEKMDRLSPKEREDIRRKFKN